MAGLISYLLDMVLPPRKTELVVRRLTIGELRDLGGEDGLPYHDPRVTALIWELKYYGTRRSAALAGEHLSEVLLAVASEELGVPLLVPIPMHAMRRRERGHNQTEVLCRATLHHLGDAVRYEPRVLQRVVHTKTQQGLLKQERLKNVRGSMLANPKLALGRACIVVDDVTTTGATLTEAERALKAAGACSVHTIALARS